jgi:uncharacterized membrane protein HdeD (DUF308 family)
MYFCGGVLVAAVIECVSALAVGRWSEYSLHLLDVPLLGVTGALLLIYPHFTPGKLTAIMTVYFILRAAFEAVPSVLAASPDRNWRLLNGYVSAVLGALVLAQWPAFAPWLIGTFIGIDLFSRGLTWAAIASDRRSVGQVVASQAGLTVGRR